MTTAKLQIGPHPVNGQAVLAPMAGLTDQPFRSICRRFGAALAVSEMTTSDVTLWQTEKSRQRLMLTSENGLKIVQIAGADADKMRTAAQAAVQLGADVIDINMGCPAKKVCRKLAGSALLKDENLVRDILEAVANAVSVPVTLKMRTGWDPDHRNGVGIAKLAESTGIKSIAVHGRTRACMFRGNAEFETIRAIKSVVSIPVFANGDIGGPSDAARILNQTKADGVMIGRAALGQPWIFQQISSFLQTKVLPKPLSIAIRRDIILEHLDALYQLYGKDRGVRVARKHLSWYCRYLEKAGRFRDIFVRVETVSEQKRLTKEFFDRYDEQGRVAVQKRSREGVPDQCQRREPRKLRQENPLDLERTRKITRYRSGTDHLEA